MDIRTELKKRILIIDGAMGTMIQRHKLQEKDYRGERFKDWHKDVQGNNDLLSITQPSIVEGIHLESFSTIIFFLQLVALYHGTHSTINNQDTLF